MYLSCFNFVGNRAVCQQSFAVCVHQIRMHKNMSSPEMSEGYLNLEQVFWFWERNNIIDVILTK